MSEIDCLTAEGMVSKYIRHTLSASPYKFTRSVMEAVSDRYEGLDDFALADALSKLSGVKVPKAVEEIRTAPILHDLVVDAPEMPATVKKILGIN